MSSEAAILTSAARAVSAHRLCEQAIDHSGLCILTRQIGRQLPQIFLTVIAQQGIDLLFERADGHRIRAAARPVDERDFQFFDLSSLRGLRSRVPVRGSRL